MSTCRRCAPLLSGAATLSCLLALAASVVLVSGRATAGGDICEDPAELRATEQAERRWRRQGKRSIPEMVDALYSDNFCLQANAKRFMEKQGVLGAERLAEVVLQKREVGEKAWYVAVLLIEDTSGNPKRRLAVAERFLPELRGSDPTRSHAATQLLKSLAEVEFFEPVVAAGVSELSKVLDDGTTPADRVCRASFTLEKIGPQASAAIPALRRRFAKAPPEQRVYLGAAMGAMGKAGAADRPDLLALVAALHKTPVKQAERRTNPWGSCRREFDPLRSTLDVIRRLRVPSPPGGDPEVLAIVRDKNILMRDRTWAARTADHVGTDLRPGDRALVKLILNKDKISRTNFFRPSVPQVGTGHYEHGEFHDLWEAFGICRLETRQDAPTIADVANEASSDMAANTKLAGCLTERLCGPDPCAATATIRACCDAAFKTAQPALCTRHLASNCATEETRPAAPPTRLDGAEQRHGARSCNVGSGPPTVATAVLAFVTLLFALRLRRR